MMNKNQIEAKKGNPLRVVVWSVAAFALLLPLIAMQFTSEVNWGFADFAVFGAMLLIAGGCYEFGTRLTVKKPYRLAIGIAVLGVFVLTWIELAVGILPVFS